MLVEIWINASVSEFCNAYGAFGLGLELAVVLAVGLALVLALELAGGHGVVPR
jgi:hypothetical protein